MTLLFSFYLLTAFICFTKEAESSITESPTTTTPITIEGSANLKTDNDFHDILEKIFFINAMMVNQTTEKLIEPVKSFLSSCQQTPNNYSEFTKLNVKNLKIEKNDFQILFYEIRIIEEPIPSNPSKKTLIYNCNSEVFYSIPMHTRGIDVVGEIQINSKDEKIANGTIKITLTDPYIIHKFKNSSLNSKKIEYENIKIDLNIHNKFKKNILNVITTFTDHIESYLILDTYSHGLSNSCIHCLSDLFRKSKKSNNFTPDNTDDLYIIPKSTTEAWKSIILSSGPIIIWGISNFTQFVVETEKKNDFNNFKITTTIGDLKGMNNWNYEILDSFNQHYKNVKFNIDNLEIQIETGVKIIDYRPHKMSISTKSFYARNFKINIGKIDFENQNDINCEKERKFMNLILKNYLEKVIVDSLTSLKTLYEKQLEDIYVSSSYY